MHHADDAPFDLAAHEGDWTMRAIPGEVSCADLKISHSHYNHTDADRDVNCMFPLTPLREFAAEGRIGSVAGQHKYVSNLVGFLEDDVLDRLREIVDRSNIMEVVERGDFV